MDDSEESHVFLDRNPGGKGGSITSILLLEVNGDQEPVGAFQANEVLLLLPDPWATQVLVTLLQFQDIHILTKRHTNRGIRSVAPPCIPKGVIRTPCQWESTMWRRQHHAVQIRHEGDVKNITAGHAWQRCRHQKQESKIAPNPKEQTQPYETVKRESTSVLPNKVQPLTLSCIPNPQLSWLINLRWRPCVVTLLSTAGVLTPGLTVFLLGDRRHSDSWSPWCS